MSWLDRAEARFGHLAIPGLGRILVGFNLLVYILIKVYPETLQLLTLDPWLVRRGEVWRLFTFIFVPRFGSFLFPEPVGILMYLLFFHYIAAGLEQALGAFKFNVYYATGVVAIILASFFRDGASFSPFLLNATLLFAFARFFPDAVIRLFFVLPVKLKWVAWTEAAYLVYGWFVYGWGYRVALVVAMSNYLLYFGREHLREAARADIAERPQRSDSGLRALEGPTLHECAVCGATEAKDPYLDFRVARDGREYCARHLPKATPEIS